MSLLLVRPSAGTAVADTDNLADVPQIYARVAWREDALTRLAWNGASTAGWSGSLTSTSSDSFGGGACLEMAAGTASWGFGTATFTADRTYRFRVGLKAIDATSVVLTLGGTATASSTATPSGTWGWYTADWTAPADGTAVAAIIVSDGSLRFDHAEVYEAADDVTLDSLTVARGSRFDGGRETPGTIDFTLLDPDDVYTPRNSASPLTGCVKPGRRVHVRATYAGRLYPIAYGIVRSVTPDPFRKVVEFHCEDGLFELDGYTVEREFASDLAYHEARAAALSTEALASDQHDLATDAIESGKFFDGTDDAVSLLDYLDDLNEATGTVHVCVPHVEAIRPWRYRTVSRATLTDDSAGQVIDEDFQELSDVSSRDESLITRQRVTWQGYEALPSGRLVEATLAVPYLTYLDERVGSTDIPEPETIYRLRKRRKVVKGISHEGKKNERRWKQRKSVRHLKKVGTRWVDSVVPFTVASGATREVVVDFQVPVEDIDTSLYTSSLEWTEGVPFPKITHVAATHTDDVEPARVTITVSGEAEVETIYVTGKPHLPLDEQEEVSDVGGTEMAPIDNEYVPSAGAAAGLAGYMTWRYGEGRLRPTVIDQHHPTRALDAEVGEHITLSADRWYIDADRYVIRSLRHEVSGGGFVWRTEYGLEELPSGGDWFRLDSDLLDGSAVLAY